MDRSGETALVEAIRAGDDRAATAFCELFAPRVRSVLGRRGVVSQDVEPLVQEILFTALEQLRTGRFRLEARLGTWLFTIVNGKAVDYWRRSAPTRRDVSLDGVTIEPSSATLASRQDDVLAVKEALGRLAPEDRLVLWLHDAEGATLEEIGRRIRRKKSAVAERLAHARERFRLAFGNSAGRTSSKLRLKE
jgi:RNA polymerase sigma-70 factor (ECF subfamily)